MRYTLDENKTIVRCGDTLFSVLDNGESTDAYATVNVIFSDRCEISGGYFRGGYFRGGVFHDGVFHDGVFHDGEFRGGWLPLQIQGSEGFVNIPDGENIQIGCQRHSVEYWLDNYKAIGRSHGYTLEQIEEYKLYIDLAATIIANNKETNE